MRPRRLEGTQDVDRQGRCGDRAGDSFFRAAMKASRRAVPLDPDTLATMRAHWAAQARRLLENGRRWGNKFDLVFTTPTGAPIDVTHLANSYLLPVLVRAGIPVFASGPGGKPLRFRFLTCATPAPPYC